jgi:CheY-like chemotaxis protein
MHTFRILVVEDFEPFRRLVRAELEQRPELYIIGQVSDGLSAVQLAAELQPDLVLIDIGLPKLNGVEAARRIREVSPLSKLLFVSTEASTHMVREILRLGAHGYIDKMQARMDLVPAVETVLADRRFLSSSLELNDDPCRHEVQFYASDSTYFESVGSFIATALHAGNPAVVLATKPHREGLAEYLNRSLDIDRASREGRYVAYDAAESISRIMVDGSPDRNLFMEAIESQIQQSSRTTGNGHRVAIYGDCAGVLCSQGNTKGAIQLEKTGADIIKNHNVDILCGYPLDLFQGKGKNPVLRNICAEHTSVCSR